MTERERSEEIRERVMKNLEEHFEKEDQITKRILSQNSPNSLLLFELDKEGNDAYVEVKIIVKKPDYDPEDDLREYEDEIRQRVVKKVKAQINKLPKKEQALAKLNAGELEKIELKKYGLKYIP